MSRLIITANMSAEFVQIPVEPETKKALIKWKDIKKTPDLSKFPNSRSANITGKINGIIVVDVDKPEAGKDEKDAANDKEFLMKWRNRKKNEVLVFDKLITNI